MIETIMTSSVLIAFIILLRAAFSTRISRRLQYALWGLVLLRLCMPFGLLGSPVSVMNALAGTAETIAAPTAAASPIVMTPPASSALPSSAPAASISADQSGVPDGETNALPHISDSTGPAAAAGSPADPPVGGVIPVDKTTPADSTVLPRIASAAWIAGSVLLAVWFTVSNLRFRVRLVKNRAPFDAPGSRLPVYISPIVASPCLAGFFKPAVYLTPKAAESGAVTYVLAHEQAHYRQGDHLWTALRSLCLIAYWWNPLVWAAAILSRTDAEMACDEAVLRQLGDENRLLYGRTLVDMVAVKGASTGLLSTAATMMTGTRQLKQRLQRIIKSPKTTAPAAVAIVLAAAVLAGCTFTGAQTAAQEPDNKAADVGISAKSVAELAKTLYDNRNPYIGDAPGDGKLMTALGVAKQLGNYTVELKTSSEPYVLKLVFSGSTSNTTAFNGVMSYYAVILLSLIDNASEIQWQYQYTPGMAVRAGTLLNPDVRTGSLTAGDAARLMNVDDIKAFGQSAEKVQELLGRLPQTSAAGASYTLSTLSGGKTQSTTKPLSTQSAIFADGLIMNSWLGTTYFPATDPAVLETAYLLQSTDAAGAVHGYYFFMKNGIPCVQDGTAGRCSQLYDNALYTMLARMAQDPLSDDKNLDSCISEAILGYHGTRDGAFTCESHVTLGTVDNGSQVTVYAMVLYTVFDYTPQGLKEVGGSHMPVAITFDKTESGGYWLREYWEPKDGSEYAASIRQKFPSSITSADVDTQKYIMGQMRDCYAQAVRYGNVDTNPIVGRLFQIITSPSASSNPDDYVKACPIEYRELMYYGKYTLDYILGEFSKGGQTGLKGQIMRVALTDLLDGQVPQYTAESPQDWFDQWKADTAKNAGGLPSALPDAAQTP